MARQRVRDLTTVANIIDIYADVKIDPTASIPATEPAQIAPPLEVAFGIETIKTYEPANIR